MLRIAVSTLLGVLIIFAGFKVKNKLSNKKKQSIPIIKKERPGVFTDVVKNVVKPIVISANGTLVAKEKIDIYSEVQGVFESSAHTFKPGVYYNEGDILLHLNNEEHRAGLQIQKSNLYQKLISVLPDLKLDYPGQFQKWNQYVNNFEVSKRVNPLPKFSTTQEKLFISGRGIQSAYFSVKNMQERLSKYSIYAPFNGILTQTNVTKGTLIRPGMKIGKFIKPNVYELEVAVNNRYSDFMKVGKSVKLHNLEKTKSWHGKVSRINNLIDPRTQSNTIFITTSGKGLKEGMYLEADIAGKEETSVYEVSRALLSDDNKIFVLKQDSVLHKVDVEPVHYMSKTVLVKGLKDGDLYVNSPVPGAFDGKIVRKL